MKLYRTLGGIRVHHEGQSYVVQEDNWDAFINDDNLFDKLQQIISTQPAAAGTEVDGVLAPIGSQELWACGVTYLRSKVGRQEESKDAGGGDFYARVYEAERPEVFFKSTPHRVVGPNGKVKIRRDSTWDVPEPELTLVVTSSGKIVGYTIGNDMSSRSIEGENPLYLPQAKTYDACAAVGPCVFVTNQPLDRGTQIHLAIGRGGAPVFEGSIGIDQMKRTPEELVSFVFRECSFPNGCLIMTGTGIVPENDFTLQSGDEVRISIDGIGTLVNEVL
ncbi:2-dehydro-3-deoxy-D-arabinonate dehydratase [Cnuella takakiae]|uniref:2-dehydro-3-deoxy-D-arabinonate dehydratase n=1 Tax=Cnuella takakiae TaxID=1302690 RepID=A0A1M4YYI0_9BACT|nr:fumarylacetoacetate hydrolase family protein [Cnuella takakiae]OLY94396.1 2-hydroxyhepta-2,4-diene-1,7-dioate isomerase [Cnuella takakiae]SHF10396.1 2-dehydro-3-deoxy-D-arabinonate dehydratase [Cnuella takakiae]